MTGMELGLGLGTYLAIGAVCVAAAALALWLFARLDRPDGAGAMRARETVHWLFDGDDLADATAPALRILGARSARGHGWDDMHRKLHSRFPGLPETAAAALALGACRIDPADPADTARLTLEPIAGQLRIGLTDDTTATTEDRHLRIVQGYELKAMRSVTILFPYPVWHCRNDGTLDWANNAYHLLADQLLPDPDTPDHTRPAFEIQLPDDVTSLTERCVLDGEGADGSMWFNVTTTRTGDNGRMNFAIGIDAVVAAEIAQRKFVQTLTKTFAQLSTGLAIFDRNRQLALFNPALIDLTALPADFLSARPNLLTFFDRLRDNRMMPEPKDYSNWRQHIADLVVAAADGRYHETWTLPSGLTYRVTGRPHPDGAIAILFEDISAEISLTRRFRAQLSLGQAVMDSLDEAIAVFSASGVLTFSNAAYRKMWKMDPDSSFAEVTIVDATRQWQSMSKPSRIWGELGDCVAKTGERVEWFADVETREDAQLECRVSPLGGGATLVGFRLKPVLGTSRKPQDAALSQG